MGALRTCSRLIALMAAAAAVSGGVGRADTPVAQAWGQALLPITGVFVLDPSTSRLDASGTAGGQPIQPQGPGSLTTSYSGAIVLDFDLDAGTIRFRPETAATAADSGSWQPRRGGAPGSEAANYGGQANILFGTGRAALRDLVVTGVTDQPIPLMPAGGGLYTFESTQRVAITAGQIDYNFGIFGSGSMDMAGFTTQNAAAPGTLQDFGDGTFGVTVPVDFTITVTLSTGLQVTVRATGSFSGLFVPESGPTSR